MVYAQRRAAWPQEHGDMSENSKPLVGKGLAVGVSDPPAHTSSPSSGSGVQLVCITRSQPTVAVGLFLETGIAAGTAQAWWLHLCEHLLFSHGFEDSAALLQARRWGGRLNAAVLPPWLLLAGEVPHGHGRLLAERLGRIVADSLGSVSWQQCHLAREWALVQAEMGASCPSSCPQVEELQEWWVQQVATARLSVLTCGDLKPEDLQQAVACLAPSSAARFVGGRVPLTMPMGGAAVRWWWPAIGGPQALNGWRLVLRWLGSDWTGSLVQVLRQHALAYEAHVTLQGYGATQTVVLQVEPLQGHTHAVIAAVHEVMAACCRQGPTPGLLAALQAGLTAQRQLGEAHPMEHLEWLAQEVLGWPDGSMPEIPPAATWDGLALSALLQQTWGQGMAVLCHDTRR